MVVQFIVFLTLSTLICRSTDISKCFSESLGIRDNESRLYNGPDQIAQMCRLILDFLSSILISHIKNISHNSPVHIVSDNDGIFF